MRLYNFDIKRIQENCIKRLIKEGYEFNDNEDEYELTPFERYEQDYPEDNFNVDNMTKDDLADWCLNSGDFLYLYNPFGSWRVSNANTEAIQEDIANDVRNCAYIEKTHKMDWIIENRFDRMFGNDYVAIFKLHNTKDGDYYVIYTE